MTAAFFAFRPTEGLTPVATVAPPPNPVASERGSDAASAAGTAASATASAVESSPSVASAAPLPSSGPLAGTVQTIDLVVARGRLVQGPRVITARAGDHVSIRITSDAEDELHLHGYNLKLHLQPNEPQTLSFDARRTGRFTYELHRHDVELGALEVYPR